MLDVIFAVSVLAAVLFFGALLSVGNERQRKAIDGLREQAARWAEADLRLKRTHLLQNPIVDDPQEWLEGVARRALGISPELVSVSTWQQEQAQALVGVCQDGRRLVVTHMQPSRFLPAVSVRGHGRLRKAEVGLLGDRPRRVPVHELSIVNAGAYFDREATQIWRKALGSPLEIERLYLFDVPPVRAKK